MTYLYVLDDQHELFNTCFSLETSLDYSPNHCNVFSGKSMFTSVLDLGTHLMVVYLLSDSNIQIRHNNSWWITSDELLTSSRPFSRKFVRVQRLNAEAYLREELSLQLLGLPFSLLNFAIQFVRFVANDCFEFCAVGELKVQQESGYTYVGLVGRISTKGYILVEVAKSVTMKRGDVQARCSRFVQRRDQQVGNNFQLGTVHLTNDSVLSKGESSSVLKSPTFPLIITL